MKQHPFVVDRFGLLAVVITLIASGASAGASTRYVSPDGRNEYPYTRPEDAAWKIQSAVDAAEEGDNVMVGAGPYPEHVVLKRGVNLSGSGRDEVTIYGVTPVKPVLTLTWDNAVKGLTIVGAPYAGIGIYAELGVPPAKTGSFTPFRISDCRTASCAGPGLLVFARHELDYLWVPEWPESEEEVWEAYLAASYDTELVIEVSECQITDCGGSGIVVYVRL